MNDQSSVERALKALREASANIQAPEHLEARLREAFRSQHRRRSSTKYAWISGSIAAAVAIAAILPLWEPDPVTAPPAPVVASVPPPVVFHPHAKIKRVVRRLNRPEAIPARREVATEFFAIPYAPVLTQADRGQLIRVRMPASSMRTFGLPVSEERMFERVRADVLLGEDGIARAIRFVR